MIERNLIISIIINVCISLVEIVVGLLIGSLAIISDAVHNFFDVGAMVMSLLGEKASAKKNDARHTYGYKRSEVLIALFNSTFLLVSIGIIGYEAIGRIFNPQTISGGWMLLMAVIAFIGNIIATKLLHTHAEESMNIKSAFLHSLQDALFSAGVIVAAILVLVFNWQWADAGISLIFSVFLANEAIKLILETVHILMEGVPSDLKVDDLRNALQSLKGIKSVNDLHVWNNGSKEVMLTAHISADIKNNNEYAQVLKQIQNLLCTKYTITHVTIQLVPVSEAEQLQDGCVHCN